MARWLPLAVCLFSCGSCGGSERTPIVVPEAPETPATIDDLPERGRYVGTNLAPISYWSSSYPFVDLVHGADGWISGHGEVWDDHQPIDTDEHGWLRSLRDGQIARLFLIGGQENHPTGRFVVTYQGKGDIEYVGRVRELERGAGRDTFLLDRPDGLFLNITNVDPDDPLRDLHVFLPGGRCEGDGLKWCEADDTCIGRCVMLHETPHQAFHPDFLREMTPFSLLRFMDWQQTNRLRAMPPEEEAEQIVEYDQIPTRDHAFWRPVPVRAMLDLTNALAADAWFSIPHTASDAFIEEFARVVARRQSTEQKVYIEYSNEAWNDMFDQHQYMNARGCASFGTPAECDPNGDGVLCEYTSWNQFQETCLGHGRRYFAERSAHIAKVFREALADRVVTVLASQVGGGDWWVSELLEHELDGAPVHTVIDAVAVAPYFGGDVQDAATVFATDGQGRYRMLVGADDAEHGGLFDWIANDLRALRRLPEDSVRYIAYEGGQHLHSYDEATMNGLLEANRDGRMERVYDQFLQTWASVTNDALFVHYTSAFVFNQHGAWGSREWQAQPLSDAPKHRALLRYIAND